MIENEKRIEELKKTLPVLERVIESLIFKRVDIKHEFHVAENSTIPYILLQFYIDIDKQYNGSPTYDEEYQKTVYEIEHKINDVLRYAGLSPIGPGVVQ